MDAALVARLLAITCWRLRSGEPAFASSVLIPALRQVCGYGAWVPARLLAELLLLDAEPPPVRRDGGAAGYPRPFVDWLAQQYERVRSMRGGDRGPSIGAGARFVRGLDRALRMHGLALKAADTEPEALVRRHLAHFHHPHAGHLLRPEAEAEALLERVLAAPGSLSAFIGPAFACVLPRACAPDHLDPMLDAVLRAEDEGTAALRRLPADRRGGDLPRIVRSPEGVFKQWAPGPLPPNLRIHPLNWTYKAVSPEYFVHLAAQGQLRQPFGARTERSNRSARVLVDVDLFESLAMHRFTAGSRLAPLISTVRAVLCIALHRLSVHVVSHGCTLSFRLRRCPPGQAHPGPWHLLPESVTAVFARSPQEVRQWLAIWLPEFVAVRELPAALPPTGGRGVVPTHHARLLIGEVPPARRVTRDGAAAVVARTTSGVRMHVHSPETFRFAFGQPESLAATDLSGEAAWDSAGQLAAFAVAGCLATTTAPGAALATLEHGARP